MKLDFISGKWTYSTTIAHTTGANGCSFKDVTCDSSIGAAAKLLLQALAMLPDAALTGDGIDATYGGDYFYINNAEAERCLVRGGRWADGGGACTTRALVPTAASGAVPLFTNNCTLRPETLNAER